MIESKSGSYNVHILTDAYWIRQDRDEKSWKDVMSQTVEADATLYEVAVEAQREAQLDLTVLESMECPEILTQEQWKQVQCRAQKLN